MKAFTFFFTPLLFLASHSLLAAEKKITQEPISYIGHGAIFGPDGSEISPTNSFLAQATKWYIDTLYKNLAPELQSEFSSVRNTVTNGLHLDEQSNLIINTSLIDWLLDRSNLKNADQIRGKNRLLKKILKNKLTDHNSVFFPRGIEAFVVQPKLLDRLAKINGVQQNINIAPFAVTTKGGELYRAECAAAGVPTPPDFGPGTGWNSQGIINKRDLIIVRGNDAEVLTWVSTNPAGMCIALPRFNLDRTVEADGVICMGKTTSKVCFWDNQIKDGEGDSAIFTFPLGSPQPFNKWAGGADLRGGVGGVCSDCHAGENPYIIHGSILESLSNTLPTFSDNWYDPIVRAGDETPWPENPGPMDSPSRCSTCHGSAELPGDAGRLPRLKGLLGYCGVLRSSIGALAPPLPGLTNPMAFMPQGRKAGTLACTPGLSHSDPRYRACSNETSTDCTPNFSESDPRRQQPDFPDAYRVSCSKEMADLLSQCIP
jgi:hypothetical protein